MKDQQGNLIRAIQGDWMKGRLMLLLWDPRTASWTCGLVELWTCEDGVTVSSPNLSTVKLYGLSVRKILVSGLASPLSPWQGAVPRKITEPTCRRQDKNNAEQR